MDEKNTQSLSQLIKKNFLTIIVLLGTILINYYNLSITSKLVPITQDLALVKQALAQTQDDIDKKADRIEFKSIDKRLERIEIILDQRLSK